MMEREARRDDDGRRVERPRGGQWRWGWFKEWRLRLQTVRRRRSRLPRRWSDAMMERVLLQLEPLAASGFTLTESFRLVEKRLRRPEAAAIRAVRIAVEAGTPLSEAFTIIRWPHYAVAALALADRTGDYDTQLAHLRKYYQDRLRFRRALYGRLAYPFVLVSLVILLLIFLLVYLIPQLSAVREQLAVLDAATTVPSGDPFVVPRLVLMTMIGIGNAIIAAAVLSRRPTEHTLRLIVRLPVWGTMLRRMLTREAAEQLGVALRAGYDILSAVRMLKAETARPALREFYGRLESRLLAGETLTAATAGVFWLDAEWAIFVESGERSGRLAEQLLAYAGRLQSMVEDGLNRLLTFIEPALLIAIGAVVFYLAMDMFMPMLDILERL
ncbi:MAG: type II secretion system F family protein [Hydrogenibacillus sp.]|nr:type II secretion system F family protein [Hydrogenibacillus sp.]